MAKRGRPPGPTAISEAAFSMYAAMGPRRSLAKLVPVLEQATGWQGKSPDIRQLQEWSSKYKWQDRVKAYDRNIAEERRIEREERVAETNDEQYRASRELFMKTIDYARGLIEGGQMGSQATVTLLKVLSDLQRLSVAADRVEVAEDKTPNIQIIIEQDNTPSPVPEQKNFKPKIIEALPSPTIEIEVDDDDSDDEI